MDNIDQEWSCSQCAYPHNTDTRTYTLFYLSGTFSNRCDNLVCEMCDAPKDQSCLGARTMARALWDLFFWTSSCYCASYFTSYIWLLNEYIHIYISCNFGSSLLSCTVYALTWFERLYCKDQKWSKLIKAVGRTEDRCGETRRVWLRYSAASMDPLGYWGAVTARLELPVVLGTP